MHPEEAIRQVAAGADDRLLASDATRRAFGGSPGLPPDATQAGLNLGQQAVAPANFDAAAAERYAAARQATAQRHATYTNAPGVGPVLAPGRSASEFRMGESQVPATLTRTAETTQAYLQAGGDAQAAQNYLTYSLRRAAETDEGTLDPAKYRRWMQQQAETLHAFPDLAKQFETAAAARTALDEATAKGVASRQAFEQSAARHFLGDADPVTTVGRILNSPDGAATMKQVVQHLSGSPAARAGLKRAAVDYILRDLRGNQSYGEGLPPILKSDAFQTFVKKSPAALSAMFSAPELQSIKNVAADLQATNRSIAATKLPGGSNTAQDLAAGAKHASEGHSVLGDVVMAEAAGELAGDVVGGLAGQAGSFAGKLVDRASTIGTLGLNVMRKAGLRKVDDLVAQAMLHPELARTLLMKVSGTGAGNTRMVMQMLGTQLRALGLAGATRAAVSPDRSPQPVARPAGIATPYDPPAVMARPPFGLSAPSMSLPR